LQEGDTLATQAAWPKLNFENGATAYLAENSVLQFTQLGFSGAAALPSSIYAGRRQFLRHLTRDDAFHVFTSTFELHPKCRVRVDDSAMARPLKFYRACIRQTTKGSTTFEKGERLRSIRRSSDPQVAPSGSGCL